MPNTETHRIEFKRELTPDIEKNIVAFLNASGGHIYFGVCDDGSVVGVNDTDLLQRQIKDRIVDNIRPGALGLFTISVEERDGKQIVDLNLAGGNAVPYYIRKYGRSERGCYLRVGSSAQPMTEEYIDKLMSSRHTTSLIDVISRHQNLTFNQLKIFYEGKGIILNQQFAKTLDLTVADGQYNQLAFLFADTNSVSIRVAKWWGTDKLDLRENEEYGECSLVKAMQTVLDKFDLENITQARKRGMKTREEVRYADAICLRELIINAFAHNDYSKKEAPVFEIYADRFEITSYGGLITGMTEEEFFSGVSRPRNPEIMRIFKDLEYVERLGSGIPSVVAKYGRSIFNFYPSYIRFVMPFTKIIVLGDSDVTNENTESKQRKTGMKIKSKGLENRKKTTSNTQENSKITPKKGQENNMKTTSNPQENSKITSKKWPENNMDATDNHIENSKITSKKWPENNMDATGNHIENSKITSKKWSENNMDATDNHIENSKITSKKWPENNMEHTGNQQENSEITTNNGHENIKRTARKQQETAEIILKTIAKTPTINIPTIAKVLSLPLRTVRFQIANLKSAGRLRRIGPDKGGYWEVIK